MQQLVHHSFIVEDFMLQILRRTLILGAIIVGGLMIVILILRFAHPRYPSPPMYPDVHHVTIARDPQPGYPAKLTLTFQTADSPDNVLSFYDTRLWLRGWERSALDTANEQSHTYRYWSGGEVINGYVHHPNLFVFTVETTAPTSELTDVTVEYMYVGPGLAFPQDYVFSPGYRYWQPNGGLTP
jgi:hypothetical protein